MIAVIWSNFVLILSSILLLRNDSATLLVVVMKMTKRFVWRMRIRIRCLKLFLRRFWWVISGKFHEIDWNLGKFYWNWLGFLFDFLQIKIVCGVNHDDLKQLFLVSKTIRDAAIIAKKSHFEFTTPLKTKAFRNSIDLVNSPLDLEEIEAPNAPKQARKMNRPRISKKRLSDISVALFSDKGEDEQRWSRRSLFMETDT